MEIPLNRLREISIFHWSGQIARKMDEYSTHFIQWNFHSTHSISRSNFSYRKELTIGFIQSISVHKNDTKKLFLISLKKGD